MRRKPRILPDSSQPKQEKEFVLPPAAENKKRVFAYLIRRGISREVIDACVQAGILYESAGYRNAVFVGRDEQGTARYAFLREPISTAKSRSRRRVTGQRQTVLLLPPAPGEFQENDGVRIRHRSHGPPARWREQRISTGFLWRIYAPREGKPGASLQKPLALNRSLPKIRRSKKLKSA